MGIDSKSATGTRLREYAALLARWPGLVARGEDALGLVADCLVLEPHLEGVRTLVDVGSGGGMPGIPLAIARPGLAVTLVESDRSKAAFLEHAAAVLGLAVEVAAVRAEDAGRGPMRDSFDAATCRALASLPAAIELCLPLVRVGGRLLAMRTSSEPAAAAAEALGGAPPVTFPAPSPGRERGMLVVVEKLAPTPAAFPRRAGVPARRPLGI